MATFVRPPERTVPVLILPFILGGPLLLLMSITDPVGSQVVLKYNDLDLDAAGEVAEVHEPVGSGGQGTERYLAFSYRQEFNIIDSVELARGRGRLWRVQLRGGKGAIASPVTFDYDSFGRLVTATRDVRTERYAYVESDQRHARNNLAVYTDPNGNQTQYEYFKRTDTFPGMAAYEYIGAPDERVHYVRDGILATPTSGASPPCGGDAAHACGGATRFEYSFVKRALSQYSAVLSQTTSVYGPRPDVSEPTIYSLDPYGGTSTIERPLGEGKVAQTVTKWDVLHQTKEWETDARGRTVSFEYDGAGNMTRRRIRLDRLSASGDDSRGADEVLDHDGKRIGQSTELWTYDPSFNQLVCHMDPNGYVTMNTIDATSGKVLRTVRYASPANQQSCGAPSGQIGSETAYQYCGIAGGSCPSGGGAGRSGADDRCDRRDANCCSGWRRQPAAGRAEHERGSVGAYDDGL
jgi:YD repeat-containing protein